MYRIPAVTDLDPRLFTEDEQHLMSSLIAQIKDSLFASKGYLATQVRYNAHCISDNGEQFGLLAYRQSPYSDRRQVLVSKVGVSQYIVDFSVHIGLLTDEEKQDPDALTKRQALHCTGLQPYSSTDLFKLSKHIRDYLLDGYLPTVIVQTN